MLHNATSYKYNDFNMESFEFSKKQKNYLFWKRLFDIVFSFIFINICIVFLWWWVIIINLFVTKGHPLFAPLRVGKDKKDFRMFKFRSMKIDAPIIPPYELTKEEHEAMETGFGRLLRKTSIDETPQLLNVFIGQMSLIGPRPGASVNEDNLIKARESYTPNAFMVKPGITGYSQVYMKRQHDVMSKAWFDSDYIKKMSFRLDFHIFFRTFFRIKGE